MGAGAHWGRAEEDRRGRRHEDGGAVEAVYLKGPEPVCIWRSAGRNSSEEWSGERAWKHPVSTRQPAACDGAK